MPVFCYMARLNFKNALAPGLQYVLGGIDKKMRNIRNTRNIPWLKWSSSLKLSILWRPETQVGASSGKLHESKQSVRSWNIPSSCTYQYTILLLKLLMENTEDAFPQIVSECFAGSGGIPACCSACGGIPTKPLYRNSYSVSRVVRSFSAQDLHTHFGFWADGCSFSWCNVHPNVRYLNSG